MSSDKIYAYAYSGFPYDGIVVFGPNSILAALNLSILNKDDVDGILRFIGFYPTSTTVSEWDGELSHQCVTTVEVVPPAQSPSGGGNATLFYGGFEGLQGISLFPGYSAADHRVLDLRGKYTKRDIKNIARAAGVKVSPTHTSRNEKGAVTYGTYRPLTKKEAKKWRKKMLATG